ncbi:Unknown protein sequence [Pseudomonas syringae pv. syringae]|nr:Unknown protein sequence [Pseudomonas syringae pv. syringae]
MGDLEGHLGPGPIQRIGNPAGTNVRADLGGNIHCVARHFIGDGKSRACCAAEGCSHYITGCIRAHDSLPR